MRQHLAWAVIGAALASAPALAQTSTAPDKGQFITQEQPGQWRATKLKGLNVYNQNNEKVGDINDMLVDESGRIQAVVVGVGGFLGLGEHDVAVPFTAIKFSNEARSTVSADRTVTTPADTTGSTTVIPPSDRASRATPDHAVLNMTKDELKAAPEFKYSRK
ncbi:PRC-barrel domain-containing protein [Methylobacterium nodulans]|uniref:PRC-barrel domain protein n=1 Tax=Methylobacterium nodulans (strain LMG 21967 / CNCM I-2342 / ORS 2060) TaxID=460265 RepID=B8IQG5_METNO|nr:PRC-barrel domain-containing protein [Methylobacterium nodulans]ACL60477.1 PRC-barrel domain protein [Methylobacterium nodulans ORS 2060]